MELRKLTYYQNEISYYRFGEGPKLAICFHGYGEEAATFEFLGKHAGKDFRFIAIDLPFHGNTEWPQGKFFAPIDLESIISQILLQEKLFPNSQLFQFTLIGFSLGGRVALSYYESQPKAVERIVLLAPDGLKVNFWYWLATQSRAGNSLFAYTMKKPAWFFGFLKGMNKLQLVNSSVFKFVKHYINDEQSRTILYERWTRFRYLKPNLGKIKELVTGHHTPVRLIYGKHDRIILPSVGQKFRKGIEEFCKISVIHSGHQVLHEKHVEEIVRALLH